MSDQHLSTQAHAALRALSVFPPKPNSFSEEAALAVTADSVETLDALWDAGLLESSAPGRYTLHQTIVDYAHMQAQEAEPGQRLVTFIVWFVRAHEQNYEALEREQSNILAALDIAEKLELSQELLQGVMALVPFMRVRGHYTLANHLLLKAFQTTLSQKEKRERLSVLRHQASFAELRGDYAQAERYYQEGLSLARSLGHREHLVTLLNNLGVMTFHRGNLKRATEYYLEGLALVRQMGHPAWGAGMRAHVCLLLSNLGEVAVEQNDFVQAEQYLREGIPLAHQLENRNYLTSMLAHLGSALGGQGNFEQANACFQESLDLARSQGSPWYISKTLVEWGELRLAFQQLNAADHPTQIDFVSVYRNYQFIGQKEHRRSKPLDMPFAMNW